jgi:hypothetical protein
VMCVSSSIERDCAAVKYHYDVGNTFYEMFLGKDMLYTSGTHECARLRWRGGQVGGRGRKPCSEGEQMDSASRLVGTVLHSRDKRALNSNEAIFSRRPPPR